MGVKSKYTLTEFGDGFRIEGRDRPPVTVRLVRTHFQVDGKESVASLGDEGGGTEITTTKFGLVTFHDLVAGIASRLMCEWEPPADRPEPIWNVRSWAFKATERAICKRVHSQWRRLLETVDDEVLAVHKSVFVATRQCAPVTCDEEFFRNPHIVSDVKKYRAAAVAALHFEEYGRATRRQRFFASDEIKAATQLSDKLGLDFHFNAFPESQSSVVWSDALEDWQGLFSPTGKRYRSLSRTLMNLPGGVSHKLLGNLNTVGLTRPITRRLELLTLLLFEDDVSGRRIKQDHNRHVFHSATDIQIRVAIARVSRATHNQLGHRKTRDVLLAVRYINDFPERHNGTIVGLAEKSIRWHQRRAEEDAQEALKELGGDRKAAEPPIPLPDEPQIRFLRNVGEIVGEGTQMQHCLGATCVYPAIQGDCYLFHVDHNNETASAQVCAYRGSVVQTAGPRNQDNKAAQWARRVLNHWGKGIKVHQEQQQVGGFHDTPAQPNHQQVAVEADVPF